MNTAARWRAATTLVAALGMAMLVTGVQARPGLYKCGETLEIKVDFTPRKAQLHLAEKQHTLLRVKSARDAHYVNRKAGITLIAKQGDMTLHEGGREHHCKLQIMP